MERSFHEVPENSSGSQIVQNINSTVYNQALSLSGTASVDRSPLYKSSPDLDQRLARLFDEITQNGLMSEATKEEARSEATQLMVEAKKPQPKLSRLLDYVSGLRELATGVGGVLREVDGIQEAISTLG